MSGIKRKIEGNDPDYEDISLAQNSKRNKAAEHDGKMSLCSEPRHSTPALYNNYTVNSDIMSYIFFPLLFQPEKQQCARLKPS